MLSLPFTASLTPAASPLGYTTNTDETALVAATNAERTNSGLAALVVDARLTTLARRHADDMARRHYFDHDSPEHESPFDRLDRAHYDYSYAGENLALSHDAKTAARDLWNSPEHRENTLETHYRRIGIGAAETPEGEIFVVDFSD